jgi:hypothetical protein
MKTVTSILLLFLSTFILSCNKNKQSASCSECVNKNINSYKDNFGLFNGSDNSTSINTADIKVKLGQPSISADGRTLAFTAKIFNTNALNNAAWGVQGQILLPDRVFITAYGSANADVKVSLLHGGLPLTTGVGDASIKTGYIYFCKQSMDRCDSFEVAFKIKISDEINPKELQSCRFNVAVFAHSQSPDQYLANNYDFWQNCKVNDSCNGTSAPSSGNVTIDFPCIPESLVPVLPICELISDICDDCTGRQQLCGGQTFVFEGSEDIVNIQLNATIEKNSSYNLAATKTGNGTFKLMIPKDFKGLENGFKHSLAIYRKVGPGCKNSSVKVNLEN